MSFFHLLFPFADKHNYFSLFCFCFLFFMVEIRLLKMHAACECECLNFFFKVVSPGASPLASDWEVSLPIISAVLRQFVSQPVLPQIKRRSVYFRFVCWNKQYFYYAFLFCFSVTCNSFKTTSPQSTFYRLLHFRFVTEERKKNDSVYNVFIKLMKKEAWVTLKR